MIEKKIEHIAYQLKQNMDNKQPGAIVLIGAGCSISAGIPRASVIVDNVLKIHKDNPDIKCVGSNPTYAELMECLSPPVRKKLFKEYVEKAKINVSHIYLAQMMEKGYVDYIVTVNFDNLVQRALALYNLFPPAYDISILKDLTTTTLDTKSITYLHGQYNGLWQLNTKEEMNKVIESNVAKDIFNKISNNRLWIVVGYSGEDFIFDQLAKLGRFDNGLYWIGYKEEEPIQRVKKELLDKPNTGSFLVRGYDSDSFFLKLNTELNIDAPKIFSTPFSFLQELQEFIIDVNDDKYKSVKDRLFESKKMIIDAISRYEKPSVNITQMTKQEIKNSQLRKTLIDCIIKEKYNDIETLERQIENKNDELLSEILAGGYNNWGINLFSSAINKKGVETDKIYKLAFEKYAKAVQLKIDYFEAYRNWGIALATLAQNKENIEAEKLNKEAFLKFAKSIEIKNDYYESYYNWAVSIETLAETKKEKEAENLYNEAIEKYAKVIELKNDYYYAYNRWGLALSRVANLKEDDEAEKLYYEAIKKYSKAIDLRNDYYEAFSNWGIALSSIAQRKKNDEKEKLLRESEKKYIKAIEIKENNYQAYNNWGIALYNLAQIKHENDAVLLYKEAIKKYSIATEIEPDVYEAYYNWGIALTTLAQSTAAGNAESLHREAIEKYKKVTELNPNNYDAYVDWGSALSSISNIITGNEAETYKKEAIIKYEQAIKIKKDNYKAYDYLGATLSSLSKINTGDKAKHLFEQAFEKLLIANKLGAMPYNLACHYSLAGNKIEALKLLRKCLENSNITIKQIENDSDWNNLKKDNDFIKLITAYK